MKRAHRSVAGQLRDAQGRWKAGAGAAVGAARNSYVRGSAKSESYVGTSGDGKFNGVKVGAQFKVPGNRTVLVKGIVGVSTKPSPAKAASKARSGAAGTKAASGRGKPRKPRASASAGRKVGR
jgi:hypothetical protein